MPDMVEKCAVVKHLWSHQFAEWKTTENRQQVEGGLPKAYVDDENTRSSYSRELAMVLPCFPIWLWQNEKMPFMAKCIHFWFGKVEENDDQAWHLDKSGGLWPYHGKHWGTWRSPNQLWLRRSQASPSRSAWGDLAGFPPPAESNHMQAPAGRGYSTWKSQRKIRKSQGKSPKVRGILMLNQHVPC